MEQSNEYQNVVLSSMEDAKRVLEALVDIINKFDVATSTDLYDLVGLPSKYVDSKWGWTNLNNVKIKQIKDGYVLDLPPLEAV